MNNSLIIQRVFSAQKTMDKNSYGMCQHHKPPPWEGCHWRRENKKWKLCWHSPDIWRNISASLRAYISSVERLIKNFQNLKEDIKEDDKKLREVIKEEISHALPVQTRDSTTKSRCPPFMRKGALFKVTCSFTYKNMENTWGSGMENTPLP